MQVRVSIGCTVAEAIYGVERGDSQGGDLAGHRSAQVADNYGVKAGIGFLNICNHQRVRNGTVDWYRIELPLKGEGLGAGRGNAKGYVGKQAGRLVLGFDRYRWQGEYVICGYRQQDNRSHPPAKGQRPNRP